MAWGYLQAHRTGKVRVAIGRAADFFGPRVLNSALGQHVFPAALAGEPVLTLGDTSLPHSYSYSYMPDVARGLATLGEREEALGRDWVLPVAPAISTGELLRLIGKAVDRPVETLNVASIAQAQAAGIFDPIFAAEYAELFYQYTEPQIVDSGAIGRAFGLWATPLSEALPATVDWFRAASAAHV